jgi:hypothetical protein
MNATTLATLETLPRETRIFELSAFTPPEGSKAAPSIESRLWKMAEAETRSQEIETVLLLVFTISRIAGSRLRDGACFLICRERLDRHGHHELAEVITSSIANWTESAVPPFDLS